MKIVIVGFSLAGFTACRYLLQNAPDNNIEIFTDEKYPYYPRPSLYRVLSGESAISDIFIYPLSWYKERNVKVHLDTPVKSIQTSENQIVLNGGDRVSYDSLLLANGARSFIPPVKGADKRGVFALRTIDDALAIREYAKKRKDAVVVGGGLLGLEISAALRKLGLNVTILEFAPWLLPRQIDQEGSNVLLNEFEKMGMEIRCGVQTEEVLGNAEVSGLKLKSGETIQADLVIFATGIRSNIELPREAGINVNRGVIVDDYMRTSVENIYAAGDIAEHRGRVYGIIPATTEQAQIAAANMIGKKMVYKGTVALNTLKVAGIDLTSIGLVNPETQDYEQIRKIEAEKCLYKKVVLKDGRIVGAIIIGDRKSAKPMTEIIKEEINVEKVKNIILEEEYDLNQLLKKPT
ncbi:MAG: NAD(P)/FAD-dependent oxidoreductase [Candidatus Freyarchaeota archaeon]|nr:NAD(P)/FAD-dependent oxidoreductase [Candidatus Jordarchaeia archaeon]MBS7278981.1 NAD(P)/FAD-dependent oxidoreductase [Candidatus Jordarchaeia archaeon]